MKRNYKYNLESTGKQTLTLPYNSQLLSVTEQYGNIVLYALVETDEISMKDVTIIIYGTGHNADDVDAAHFLGTVKLMNGGLMFHVFYQ